MKAGMGTEEVAKGEEMVVNSGCEMDISSLESSQDERKYINHGEK